MNAVFAPRGRHGRRLRPRNLIWIIPAVLVVGAGVFLGLGALVAWLWRVTLVDIFAIKPISFWQAWGLILLSQFLFKANMRPTTRTGRWRRHRMRAWMDAPATDPEEPPHGREG